MATNWENCYENGSAIPRELPGHLQMGWIATANAAALSQRDARDVTCEWPNIENGRKRHRHTVRAQHARI